MLFYLFSNSFNLIKLTKEYHFEEEAKAESAASKSGAAESREELDEDELAATNYGDINPKQLQSVARTDRKWTRIQSIDSSLAGEYVLVRGRVDDINERGCF